MRAEANRRDRMTPHERRIAMERGRGDGSDSGHSVYWRDIGTACGNLQPGVLA